MDNPFIFLEEGYLCSYDQCHHILPLRHIANRECHLKTVTSQLSYRHRPIALCIMMIAQHTAHFTGRVNIVL